MSRERNRPDHLKTLEDALGSLIPRDDRLDRDRLMFLAGQASVAGQGNSSDAHPPAGGEASASAGARWAWPAAFSAMTALAASLLVALLLRPAPQVVVREVQVPAPSAVVDEGNPSRNAEEHWQAGATQSDAALVGSSLDKALDEALGQQRSALGWRWLASAAHAGPSAGVASENSNASKPDARGHDQGSEEHWQASATPASSYRQLRELYLDTPGSKPASRPSTREFLRGDPANLPLPLGEGRGEG